MEVLFRFIVLCVFVVHVVRSVILAHAVGGIVLINSLSCLITYSRWCYLDIFISNVTIEYISDFDEMQACIKVQDIDPAEITKATFLTAKL